MLCLAGFDGYFMRINSAWTRTLGFTQDELMARRSSSLRNRAIGTRMQFMSDDVDEMEASASSWDRRPLDY
jgi:hypothetical protein